MSDGILDLNLNLGLVVANQIHFNQAYALQEENSNKLLIQPEYLGKITITYKDTRAGCTHSLIKNGVKRGHKTAIIEPYLNCFETVISAAREAGGVVAKLTRNQKMCKQLENEQYNKKDDDWSPFYLLGDCDKCPQEIQEKCYLQWILRGEWDVIVLTPQKLRALQLSKSLIAKQLLNLIFSCDNLIIDEASSTMLSTLPELKIPIKLTMDSTNEFDSFSKHLETKFQLSKKITESKGVALHLWLAIRDFAKAIDNQRATCRDKTKNYPTFINPVLSHERKKLNRKFHAVWKSLKDLKLGMQAKLLWDILPVMLTSQTLHISYVEKPTGEETKKYHIIKPIWNAIFPRMLSTNNHIAHLLQHFSKPVFHEVDRCVLPNKRVFFVDACQLPIEFYKWGGLGSFFLKSVNSFIWGDPLHTNNTQLVICDSRKFGNHKFFDNDVLYNRQVEDKIVEVRIKTYVIESLKAFCGAFGSKRILVSTSNSDIYKWIKKKKALGLLDKELELTYFGSDISRGITPYSDRDILVFVGGAYIPKNSYKPETLNEEFNQETVNRKVSELCRIVHQQGAMINMMGRVKDPLGKKKSLVIALGITKDEMIDFIYGKCVEPPHITGFSTPVTPELCIEAGQLWFDPKCIWNKNASKGIGTDATILHKMRVLKQNEQVVIQYPLTKLLPTKDRVEKEENRKMVGCTKANLETMGLRVDEFHNGGFSFTW